MATITNSGIFSGTSSNLSPYPATLPFATQLTRSLVAFVLQSGGNATLTGFSVAGWTEIYDTAATIPGSKWFRLDEVTGTPPTSIDISWTTETPSPSVRFAVHFFEVSTPITGATISALATSSVWGQIHDVSVTTLDTTDVAFGCILIGETATDPELTVMTPGTGTFLNGWNASAAWHGMGAAGGKTLRLDFTNVTTIGNSARSFAAFVISPAAAPTGPTIDTQPQDASIAVDNSHNFTIAATTSGGALSYQWQIYSGGIWNNIGFGGSTTNSFTTTVKNSTVNSGEQYRCLVTDDNGTTTSAVATLTITSTGPIINTQPTNQTVTEPNPATFTIAATATDSGSLSYQWQSNASGTFQNINTGTGFTSASYTTTPTSVASWNGVLFRCLVTDTNGTTTSAEVTLTVNAPAAATIHTGTIVNQTTSGFDVRFTTDIGSGTAYYVVYPTTSTDPIATQIVAQTDGDDVAALANGSMTVVAPGVQTFSSTTGLNPNVVYRVSVVHYT